MQLAAVNVAIAIVAEDALEEPGRDGAAFRDTMDLRPGGERRESPERQFGNGRAQCTTSDGSEFCTATSVVIQTGKQGGRS